MTEGTRIHQLSESMRQCQEMQKQHVEAQKLQNQEFQKQFTEISAVLQTIVANQGRIVHDNGGRDDRRRIGEEHGHVGGENGGYDRIIQTRAVRLDFPRFEGENPSHWVYKVNQFFEYYQTPIPQRLRMASFHMEGDALIWFQDAEAAGLFPSWEAFIKALLTRFGPAYDDPMEALTRLRQTSTVAVYKAQFEALSNRLRGISEQNKLSCFLSGLKDEIRLPLRMLNPLELSAAFGLAKLQEEYLLSTKKSVKPFGSAFGPNKQQNWTPGSSSGQSGAQNSKNPSSSMPIQRISPEQMRERRQRGLCYNCDEKWNPSHKCQTPKIYLMHGMEVLGEEKGEDVYYDSSTGEEMIQLPEIQECTDPEISLYAISGSLSPKTMRLVGKLKNQLVVILIDSGSTHNFIDPAVAKKARLPCITTTLIQVKVANGAQLNSEGRCNAVTLKMQGNTITTAFYVLTLGGCDIVLGIEWLRTLGPILWDFLHLTMQYSQAGKQILLTGLNPMGSTMEDGNQFLKTFTWE
jgi:hypothetical protein